MSMQYIVEAWSAIILERSKYENI